eukprot:Amastigsp_a847020_18.p3 type:complete len:174 gc:universal Amastigsp_a847020_18:895-374(-)
MNAGCSAVACSNAAPNASFQVVCTAMSAVPSRSHSRMLPGGTSGVRRAMGIALTITSRRGVIDTAPVESMSPRNCDPRSEIGTSGRRKPSGPDSRRSTATATDELCSHDRTESCARFTWSFRITTGGNGGDHGAVSTEPVMPSPQTVSMCATPSMILSPTNCALVNLMSNDAA